MIPSLLIGGIELGLRLAGYGFDTHFFKKLAIGGSICWVDNDQFGFRFFPPALARIPSPVVMKASKPPGSIRIFVFGESAALGDPRPHYGAARYLEAMLRERYPETDFEVVNTSMTAINSHAILPIARECAGHQGDLWLIYMGNNEMVGPFGAATVFGKQAPSLRRVRLNLALQRWRLGQLLVALSQKAAASNIVSWHGMEMFLQNKVPPGDRRKETVYRSFGQNLEDILQAGASSGAKVVLSTVAVNLRDCPPFASLSGVDLGPSERGAYEQACAEAEAAATRGARTAVEQSWARAVTVCPQSAEAHFRLAGCLLEQTNAVLARTHLLQALDLDTLPFRTDSRINDLIRATGRAHAGSGLVLCDAAVALATSAPGGVPGQESFYEHVHLNFDGNYRLALAWAEAAEQFLPSLLQTNRSARAGGWASQQECERRLALTDWNRESVLDEVIGRLEVAPFSGQSNNAGRMAALQAQAKELHQRSQSAPAAPARQLYVEALQRAPDDYRLHEGFAELLDKTGDLKQATLERQKVRDLIPHYYFSHYALGQALKQENRLDEAKACMLRAAELNPRQSEIRSQLGAICVRQKQWEQAAREYEQAHQLEPDNPRLLLYGAEVGWKLERRAEAIAKLQQALRLKPDYWEAHYRLGEDLALQGQLPEAAAEFERVIRLNPKYVKAHVNLAVALLKLGREQAAALEFEEVLRLDPQNRQALDFKRRGRD